MRLEIIRRCGVVVRGISAAGVAVAALATVGAATPGAKDTAFYNVREFGAKGDGQSLDTGAIQAAITACSTNGGGTVVVPAGVFRSGTIVLQSRVALWLQPGAVVLGSTELKDYPAKTPAYRSYTDVNYVERSLIYAERVEDIAIFGQGTINGQGEAGAFQLGGGPEHYKARPYLIRMSECQRVTVAGITLRNAPMWVQHYLACDDVTIDGITVHSQVNANNDGIDIDGCSRVRVANCSITCGDDAIVLKSTGPRPCRAITVTNCYLSTHCAAIKCGTESTGGFYDLAISNCIIADTHLSGIALEVVDGGIMDGVTISNIQMRRTRGGIFVRLGNRARPHLAEGPGGGKGTHRVTPGMVVPGVGRLRNVRIAQVSGDGNDSVGCSISGLPGHPVEDVVLDGIALEFAGGGVAASRDREVPEEAAKYPDYRMFGRLPAYGFYCRHVRGLRLSNVQLALASPDARPGLVCDDVQDLEIRGWRGASALPPGGEEILLRDSRDVWIHGSRSAGGPVLVRVSGKGSGEIRLSDNWCRPPTRLVALDAGVHAEAVVTAP